MGCTLSERGRARLPNDRQILPPERAYVVGESIASASAASGVMIGSAMLRRACVWRAGGRALVLPCMGC